MITHRLLSMMLVCFLAGCATLGSEAPGPGPSMELSSSRYLLATGIGQTDAEARRMAKAELSAIFESEIESRIDSSVKLTTTEKGEDLKKKTEANIRVKSSVQLQGVEIKNTRYDEKNRSYYAIAALDKLTAREQWGDRLAAVEQEVNTKFERLETLNSPVLKLELIRTIYDLMLEKEVLTSRLRVIGFSPEDPSAYNALSTMEMAEDIKSNLLICIDIDGSRASEVVGKLSEDLTRNGYKLEPRKNRADVFITGNVATQPVKLDNDQWAFSRATVSIAVRDLASGKEVVTINKSVRKGHLNRDEASRRAARAAAQKASLILLDYFGI